MKLTISLTLLAASLAHTTTRATEPTLEAAALSSPNLPLLPLTTRQQTVIPIAVPEGSPWISPSMVSNYAFNLSLDPVTARDSRGVEKWDEIIIRRVHRK